MQTGQQENNAKQISQWSESDANARQHKQEDQVKRCSPQTKASGRSPERRESTGKGDATDKKQKGATLSSGARTRGVGTKREREDPERARAEGKEMAGGRRQVPRQVDSNKGDRGGGLAPSGRRAEPPPGKTYQERDQGQAKRRRPRGREKKRQNKTASEEKKQGTEKEKAETKSQTGKNPQQ